MLLLGAFFHMGSIKILEKYMIEENWKYLLKKGKNPSLYLVLATISNAVKIW